jgi:radical SAM protein with 4Fe4S-binding SPASM domain
MTSIQYEQNHDAGTPVAPTRPSMKLVLRDFITKRHESFGGYLFNPHLFSPIAFNQSEMNAIDLIDGENSVAEVADSLYRSMGDMEAARLALNNALGKAHRMFALKPTEGAEAPPSPGPPRETGMCRDATRLPSRGLLSAPLSVLWDVTYACNLRCRHCLTGWEAARDRELTTAEAEIVIDKLADAKVFTITFSGGEPFVRKDMFRLLCHASKRNIGIKILTNGTLVSKAAIKRLDECNVFSVQISLDGLEKTHDRLRNKAGAWRKAVQAIERFAEAGYHTVVAPVVTQQNFQEIEALVDIAASLGASAFKPTLFMPDEQREKDRPDFHVPKREIRGVMSKLEMKQKAFESNLQIQLESGFQIGSPDGGTSNKSDSRGHGKPVGCSAGHTQLVITASGDVAACPFLFGFSAGNLRRETLDSIWHTSPVLNRFRALKQSGLEGKCGSCRQVPEKCFGGCRAAAYLCNGNLCGEGPVYRVQRDAEKAG